MVEIELDGKKVEVPPGSMIMHAAEKAGVYVPHFCYHKKLSIAANCRMCLVDVEKAPKPMPACATPVTMGMVVRTRSDKAIKAQKAVMEFLLINHPLDCPICDQGGECQLQDLAVGYGGTHSRYEEEKRIVLHKNVGPLISMEEMSRCIHCTRCVRFGQEIAGVMELGMSHRGEHSEIETFVGQTVDSELSGNMIDLCPVGALTSKPFRYAARTWELSRRKSISPHDSTGANLIVQVKGDRVLRVVPLENEAVNECWIADRDRFSYEALNSPDRLTQPMIKQGGEWRTVDWSAALEYVANGLKGVRERHGAGAIGLLASPHATVEELALARALMAGLGSPNLDHRLRAAAFDHAAPAGQARWLGLPIADLSTLDRVFVVGSNLRKDHPLFAQRIRQAARKGAQVSALVAGTIDWAMPLHRVLTAPAADWVSALAGVAAAVAEAKGVALPAGAEGVVVHDAARAVAQSLISGERQAVLLGNAAAHHARAASLLALAQWIAEHTGARWGYLTEAANTVGAQLVGALPGEGGLDARRMLGGALKAAVLLGVEPGADTAGDGAALATAELVVTLSPFQTNLDISDVLLPVAPFTETSGSFVNAEGRLQSFQAVVKPQGETRPAWKVLRVLGNLLGLPGFEQTTSQEVLAQALPGVAHGEFVSAERLNNRISVPRIDLSPAQGEPCVAAIYQLDALVRRAPALQATADGRAARAAAEGVCA
ncbi:MAG: NADH-quinone oxidoreductase subunit NuoG [Tepidimonas sp.]|uniref:NADH-quinone oxidoreductase subunit NuoG n=1 Tax=Tepidimonas sp. TaxID=2002775 RepID=UPI00259EA7A9|nr:NADH-quinone oxidoreductase subunit NuoG [Tepidimonas sp.]MDM7455925.1 NADH-quinone oxidoreductase subunit NuoG [Tepidimonas sp.]